MRFLCIRLALTMAETRMGQTPYTEFLVLPGSAHDPSSCPLQALQSALVARLLKIASLFNLEPEIAHVVTPSSANAAQD